MWTRAHAKRFVYLFHRWSGIGFCLLMLLWLVSGVVMLFVGYPKLLPQERLQALPTLQGPGCCVPAQAALAHSSDASHVQELLLTSVAGQPRWRLREGDGTLRLVDARSGGLLPPPGDADILASARSFVPGAGAHLQGQTQDDRWTHARLLDPHRPLFIVQMDDAARTRLYLSSRTGEVMLDAPAAQRNWNAVGAWLHWLYMFRDGSRDPFWTWLLIALSALGTLSVVAGASAGLWRWRFSGHYKTGRRTPYRDAAMRWHHVMGLSCGLLLIVWMFSGLMSMNPLGLFDPAHGRPDLAAYRGKAPGAAPPGLETSAALALLHEAGFAPAELEWKALGGTPYLLARAPSGASRLVVPRGRGWQVQDQWSRAALLAAAAHLRPAAIVAAEWLHEPDAFYYARSANSMYAGNARELPVLRLTFADAGRTQVYLDPRSGDVVHSVDRAQRTGRWLFNLLHSWDLPALLQAGAARDAALIGLSLGMLAIVATGCLIGYRRLRAWLRPRLAPRLPLSAARTSRSCSPVPAPPPACAARHPAPPGAPPRP